MVAQLGLDAEAMNKMASQQPQPSRKSKKGSEPAPVKVFARWKPLKKEQKGLELRLSKTTIEFDVKTEGRRKAARARAKRTRGRS